ncbi:MAG: hypothetical protein IJZ39_00480 [Oscillospiraceae bacterium]|nr:hypothetical protein [Oscillospiraceae bacterium]
MVLPLYLAMTAREMADADTPPPHFGWMACHFDPDGPGLRDIPEAMPPGAMLILNDRVPCRGHDPARIAAELAEAAARLRCDSVLLDFEREPDENSGMVAHALFEALPCPVAAPPGFSEHSDRPVFLPPCPLHVPLAKHLCPWQGREIWLDVTRQQQTITVTPDGTQYLPAVSTDRPDGGRFDETLLCQYLTDITADEVTFTLFDTPETLKQKLRHAASLGVVRTVGLFQELK